MASDDELRKVHIVTDLTFEGKKHHYMIMVLSTATFPQIMEIAESEHNSTFKYHPPIKALDIELMVGGTRRSKIIDGGNINLRTACRNELYCRLFLQAEWLEPAWSEPAAAPAAKEAARRIHDAMKEAAAKSNEDLIREATEAYEASAELHIAEYYKGLSKIAELEGKLASLDQELHEVPVDEWVAEQKRLEEEISLADSRANMECAIANEKMEKRLKDLKDQALKTSDYAKYKELLEESLSETAELERKVASLEAQLKSMASAEAALESGSNLNNQSPILGKAGSSLLVDINKKPHVGELKIAELIDQPEAMAVDAENHGIPDLNIDVELIDQSEEMAAERAANVDAKNLDIPDLNIGFVSDDMLDDMLDS